MENRYYRIGELASVLNLSRQMIRYYEECGVISPERITSNNYRLYSAMDYFAVAEAISLSRFDINIKDIFSLKMSDYNRQMKKHFEKYIETRREKIQLDELMIERAEHMMEKSETASLNMGNVWIRKVNAHYMYPMMHAENDTYGEIITPEEVRPYINQSSRIVFGDGIIEFHEKDEDWWISFDEQYHRHLNIPSSSACRYVKEEYCLCTVMDMGEIGSFNADEVRRFVHSDAVKRYDCSDRLYGVLLSRGEENGSFHRYLEIRIPLKSLQRL